MTNTPLPAPDVLDVLRMAIPRPEPMIQPLYKRIGPANWNQCQSCLHPLGVRLDRGCTWSERFHIWVDACDVCKSDLHLENSDIRRYRRHAGR